MRLVLLSLVAAVIATPLACSDPTRVAPANEVVAARPKRDAGRPKPLTPESGDDDDDLPPGSGPTPVNRPDGGGVRPPPSPTKPAPPPSPPAEEFRRVDLRYPAGEGMFVTQCTADGASQLVWRTTGFGSDEYSRWATAEYTEASGINYGCGTMSSGHFPIVLSGAEAGEIPSGTFVVRCIGIDAAHIYKVTTVFGGHPAATFLYPEAYPGCS